jgi:hypothetical protein
MRAWLPILALVSASAASTTAPIASSVSDVIGTAAGSFATVGTVGFLYRFPAQLVKRAPVPAAATAAVATAQRWGRLSAGFAGGRAAGQLVRKADDTFCAVCGAVMGGAAAATSVAELPGTVATFVGFTLALEILAPSAGRSAEGEMKSAGTSAAEARAKARRDFERRHQDDPARLQATRGRSEGS